MGVTDGWIASVEAEVRDALRQKQIDAEVARRMAKLEELGEDPYDDGDVFQWSMKFEGTDTTYTYVAIKINGVFYTTAKYNSVKTWDEIRMAIVNDSTIPPYFRTLTSF
jgi:hypothetical protein